MSDPAVLLAVRDVLAGLPDMPDIYWPNGHIDGALPWVIFDNGSDPTVEPFDYSLGEQITWRPQISVCVPAGDWTVESDAICWTICQAFARGTRITANDDTELARSLRTPVATNGRLDFGDTAFRRDIALELRSWVQVAS